MKRRLSLLLVFILILGSLAVLTACDSGGEDKGEDINADSGAEEEEKDNKGTRSNPINVSETVEWNLKFYADVDDWDGLEGLGKVTLNKVYEGEEAIDMLYFGEEELEDIEEGYTFAVADYTVELVEGDDDHPYTTSFMVGSVSDDGRESPFDTRILADKYEDNEYTDLYPGGSVDIMQSFLIPEDGDYLIEIEENISGSKFFKSK